MRGELLCDELLGLYSPLQLGNLYLHALIYRIIVVDSIEGRQIANHVAVAQLTTSNTLKCFSAAYRHHAVRTHNAVRPRAYSGICLFIAVANGLFLLYRLGFSFLGRSLGGSLLSS